MTSIPGGAIPLACCPGAIPGPARVAHFRLVRQLFTELAEHREPTPGGWAVRFPADQLEAVQRFVLNEHRCCPFLTLTVEVSPGNGPVWLRLEGPEGTRDFLAAELALQQGAP